MRSRSGRCRIRGLGVAAVVASVAALVAGLLAVAPPASAGVVANTASTSFTGEGFDVYTAQPTSDMRAWLGSPMRAVGIYVGGVNRYDTGQPNLTPTWVATMAASGWRFIPTYVGLQAPCTTSGKRYKISPSQAYAQGRSNAADAIARMKALGLGPGNPVYLDMEPFDYAKAGCVKAVATFFDGWIGRLHGGNFKAGIYGSRNSTVRLLVANYFSARHRRPDDVWYAAYDGRDRTTGEPTIPDAYWPHHRIHQYTGGTDQTWNGVTINIDQDAVDGDVADASVAAPPGGPPYPYAVSGTQGTPGLNERTAPSTAPTSTVVATLPEGSPVQVVCQVAGDAVFGDPVWDQLQDGNYVSDLYTTTPGGLAWAGTVPRCDGTPAGHLMAPRSGLTVEAGRPVTVGGQFAATAGVAAVTFQASADRGTTWTTIGTDGHGGNGGYSVSWSPAWTGRVPVVLQATVTDALGAVAVSDRISGIRVVDTTAPRAGVAARPLATLASAIRVSWAGFDAGAGVASYDVRYRRASFSSGFGAWTSPRGWTATTATGRWLRLARGYDYCFEVRARDRVGNLSRWSGRHCVTRALDDRAMAATTAGWTRGTGSPYYQGTVTATKQAGRVLTRTGARVVRVGLVATTCARCGTVTVRAGGHLVGRIALTSQRVLHRQILLLPRFAYRAGPVVVTTLTSGRTVQIDGLVLART